LKISLELHHRYTLSRQHGSMSSTNNARPKLADAVVLRSIGLDEYSVVRFVHDASFRAHCAAHLSEDDVKAFRAHVNSPRYIDELQLEDLIGAWLDGELIGTAGWMPADDQGLCARIGSLFVRPLFSHIGIGKLLLAEAESRARRAGFKEFSTRVMPHAVPFLQRVGYEVTSRGVQPFGKVSCAVAFMRKWPAASSQRIAIPAPAEIPLAVPGAPADLQFASLVPHEREI
jgi:GNAT superfamily N-acetyltransferase